MGFGWSPQQDLLDCQWPAPDSITLDNTPRMRADIESGFQQFANMSNWSVNDC